MGAPRWHGPFLLQPWTLCLELSQEVMMTQKKEFTVSAVPGSLALQQLVSSLAGLFQVSDDEIALLRVQDSQLVFVLPERLRDAGSIPLSATATSIAARTVASGKAELHNRAISVRHASVFEGMGEKDRRQPIHKMMSVPLSRSGLAVGVVQVSRKGAPDASVPDFTADDLKTLTQVVASLSDVL